MRECLRGNVRKGRPSAPLYIRTFSTYQVESSEDVSDSSATPQALCERSARIISVDLSQSAASLPLIAVPLFPRSFTVATQQVLGSISPLKRPSPTFALRPQMICRDSTKVPLHCVYTSQKKRVSTALHDTAPLVSSV